jgi:HEAT repeat protein
MIPLLKSDDSSIRAITAELLSSFGYKEALPHLKRALEDSDKLVRKHVESAIENIINPEKDTPPDIGYPGYSWQNYPRHSYNPNE